METKWTPGPWKVLEHRPHSNRDHEGCGLKVASNQPYMPDDFGGLAYIQGRSDDEEIAANAKLIAKAPELAEQLSLLLRDIADWRENGKPDLYAFLESYKGAERVLREAGAID